MQSRFYPLLMGFLLPLFFSSCGPDTEDVNVTNNNPEFAVPLFSTSTDFGEVLAEFGDDTFISFDENGLLTANYRGDVQAKTSTEIFDVLAAYNDVPFPLLDTLFALPFSAPGNIDLDFITLKTGTFQWGFSSMHEEDITVTLTLPNLLENGEPTVITRSFDYNGSDITYLSSFIDVAGFDLIPTNDSIYVQYSVYREQSGFADTAAIAFVRLKDFTASYVEGYLGQEVYEIDRDTIEIDLFENWVQGEVFFVDPKITVTVANSFGFPVRSLTNVLNVISVDGEILPIESTFVTEGIDFDYPILSEVGEVKTTTFSFDTENSNVDDVVAFGPVAIDYDLDALANPEGNLNMSGFMTDSSFFRVQVEAELPIWGTAKDFQVWDTLDLQLNDYENVESVEFKIVSENEIPLDVAIQGFFFDGQGVVLDSLFDSAEIVLPAAAVDDEANITGPSTKTTFIPFDANRFDGVRTTEQLLLRFTFATYENGSKNVKIRNDQLVNIRAGMKVQFSEF